MRSGNIRASSRLPRLFRPDADDRLVAAILYGAAQLPMDALLARVKSMYPETKERVVDEYLQAARQARCAGARAGAAVLHGRDDDGLRRVPGHPAAPDGDADDAGTDTRSGYEMPPEIETFGYARQYEEADGAGGGDLCAPARRRAGPRGGLRAAAGDPYSRPVHLEPARSHPLCRAALGPAGASFLPQRSRRTCTTPSPPRTR